MNNSPHPQAPSSMDVDGNPEQQQKWGEWFAYCDLFLKQNSRMTKKDFIRFVKYYNEHKDELNLNDREKEALGKLHDKWKSVSEDANIIYYYYGDMKQYHTVMNGRLLRKSEEYTKYIINFMAWRGSAVLHLHKLTQFMAYQAEKKACGSGSK